MALEIGERHAYVRLLAEHIEAENRARQALSEQLRRR